MTNNIIPRFPVRVHAAGFNPLGLTDQEVGEGWRLLEYGDGIFHGDGFYYEPLRGWVDFECRADVFRGLKSYVHTVPWRRRV